jgi:hypothetical protein
LRVSAQSFVLLAQIKLVAGPLEEFVVVMQQIRIDQSLRTVHFLLSNDVPLLPRLLPLEYEFCFALELVLGLLAPFFSERRTSFLPKLSGSSLRVSLGGGGGRSARAVVIIGRYASFLCWAAVGAAVSRFMAALL